MAIFNSGRTPDLGFVCGFSWGSDCDIKVNHGKHYRLTVDFTGVEAGRLNPAGSSGDAAADIA
jgi:hypothetical protein